MRKEAIQTLRLAGPIIVGELAQMGLHIIDTAMIGALDYRQLAAAALVINAMNIPFVLGIGMTISVSQLVAMAHGRGDERAVTHYAFNGFVLCGLTAVLIAALLLAGSPLLLHLGQDPDVAVAAVPFMRLMGFSILPMLLFMTLKQFADGLEYTRTAMIFSLLALPVNAGLNWILIYGHWGAPRLGLNGAGWATLVTRSIMCVLLAIVVLRHRAFRPYVALREEWVLRAKTLKALLGIGIPSALQVGMEAGAFAVTGILIGTLGAVAQAAHQIALSCAAFTFMVSMGLAQAGSIRVSNAFGRGSSRQIIQIGNGTLLIALAYGITCALGFVAFRQQLPLFFNNNPEVAALAALLLLFAAIFQVSDATQAVGAGLLRGIKDVKVPTWLIFVAYWIIGLPVGCLLGFRLAMGAAGFWLGLILGLSFASFFLYARFRRRSLVAP
ncbi:MATE family efflux transporter [Flaviaesturariibacter flavus]|uniref:Multidrug-efflux transporter n=1 Tax=Flaviaesturariibacter flavus TaxID=2502780 RepID=A0A4R1B405_9BACT|nr:MATE family efflux transporter [Flaviaesturariibacter flavus]TCJ12641.1 MATE family efflux transporter [Flaviaesturariibacter flavus]